MNLSATLAERLKSVSQKSIQAELKEKHRGTDIDWAYRTAAAVVSHFDPYQLRPAGAPQREDAQSPVIRLLRDCVSVRTPDAGERWMLKHPVRKEALSRLNTRRALRQALAAHDERPDDVLQHTLEAYLNDTALPVDQQPLQQLRYSHQVIDWLGSTEIAADLPRREDVERLIEWRQLLEPFHYLVGDHFRGRVDELTRLHTFVFEETTTAPLLIYGPGGTGKSTLLSKFILDVTANLSAPDRLPFAYIDFDRLVATPEEPLTLLMEAARQLAIQYPDIAEKARYFADEWSYRLTATDTRSVQNQFTQKIDFEAFSKSSFGRSLRSRLDINAGYIYDFATLLQESGAPAGIPFLLVLDTFEEVQFRSRDQVSELSYFFDELLRTVPRVRIVIAGRGLIEDREMNVTPLELEEFDEPASVGFLTYKGIQNAVLAGEIFRLVGGNPLSLKLAADLVRNEGLNIDQQAGLEELKTVLRKVEENNIQGQLYRRILEHVKDPDIRKLAHPGLALRYVSAALIKDVLASPCGLSVPDELAADRLFEKLQNEVSLVSPDPHRPDVLRHRPDVRAVMIQALQNDEPLIVHEIHRGAIRYYEAFDDPQSRAEEIYHRLFAESDFSAVEHRWEAGWEEPFYQALRPALTEFPPAARAWLAGRLGITGVAVDWDEADLRDWERLVSRRVEDMIYSNRFDEAYRLLSERSERTAGSPLYYYETQILIQQKRWEEARRCVKEGLYSMRQAQDDKQLLVLLKQAIQIDMHLAHHAQAQKEILQARTLLKFDDEPQLTELEFGLYELAMLKAQPKTSAETIESLEDNLLLDFERLSDRHLRASPRVVRMMLSAFGDEDLEVLRRGLRIMTLGDPTPEQRESIGHAMARWDAIFSETNAAPAGSLLETVGRPLEKGASVLDSWLSFTRSAKARELSESIQLLLDKFGDRELETAAFEEEEAGSPPEAPVTIEDDAAPPPAPSLPPLPDIPDMAGAPEAKPRGEKKRRAKKKRFDAGSILGKALSGSILSDI